MVDLRTNQVFVQDVPSRLEDVRKLIAKLDIPVRQVLIEARIVEANDTFSKNSRGAGSGLQPANPRAVHSAWTGRAATYGADLNDTAQSTISAAARSLPRGRRPLTPPGQNVNLPAAGIGGFNAGGAIASFCSTAASRRFLNLELSALEADGKGKIISSPRVLTANNVEALIEQGTELPYQQATSSGATSVSFRKANLALKVKPQITPDGNIIMTLDINKDSVGQVTGGRLRHRHQARQDRGAGRERRHGGDRRHLYSDREQRSPRCRSSATIPFLGDLFRNN